MLGQDGTMMLDGCASVEKDVRYAHSIGICKGDESFTVLTGTSPSQKRSWCIHFPLSIPSLLPLLGGSLSQLGWTTGSASFPSLVVLFC